jgi:zinc transport system substrate-binding protein
MRSAKWLGVVLSLALLSACGFKMDPEADGKVSVVAAFYPLQFLAQRIGGDRVYVVNLVKAGAEPHDLELAPRDVGLISEADIVIYLRGFQPAVDEAIIGEARRTSLDVAAIQPLLNGGDPHIWLDPARFAAIGDRVAERLATVDPANAGEYRQRAAGLRHDLDALDSEYENGLKDCKRREIVTSHEAFGYLADRYKLSQVAINGLNPDTEPSAKRLAQVSDLARARGVTTIFFESLVSPKIADTLAREVGARTAVLDPIEGIHDQSKADYLSVMRVNLAQLRVALDCE